MAKSLRDQILASDDIQYEDVEVPEWGVTVRVSGMSGKQRASYIKSFTNDAGDIDYEAMYPSLLIRTVVDPDTGERVFDPSDADALNAKAGSALERVAKVALRISGMDPNAEDRLGKPSLAPSESSTSI